VGLGALSPASRSCSEPGAVAAGAALASDGWALALEPLDCFEAGEELLEGITSSWPGWIFLGSVMLLVTAMSPCLTPYLRAIPPRVSPGLTVCLVESPTVLSAGACSAGAASGAGAATADPGLEGLLGM